MLLRSEYYSFGGIVKTWGILRPAGLALALVVGSVALGAAPANAATPQDVAAWITETTLENLGVSAPDSELAAALNSAISDALEAGVISLGVEKLAEQAIDDPDSVDDGDVGEALNEELGEQGDSWDEVKAEWHAAFDTIKADFAECREAAEGGANLCAHQFRYEMQVNHVTAWQARHAAKIGDINALPEDEQVAALAKLERQGDKAAARRIMPGKENMDRKHQDYERHYFRGTLKHYIICSHVGPPPCSSGV